MFKQFARSSVLGMRTLAGLARASGAVLKPSAVSPVQNGALVPELTALKFDSNGNNDLYAICKIHNMPYLVTKGDRLVLPYKIRNMDVGDVLKLDNVTTLGSRNFTYSNAGGIAPLAYSLTATLTEITREPKYHVYKKKPRCRRLKTVEVEPFQTHLTISELRVK